MSWPRLVCPFTGGSEGLKTEDPGNDTVLDLVSRDFQICCLPQGKPTYDQEQNGLFPFRHAISWGSARDVQIHETDIREQPTNTMNQIIGFFQVEGTARVRERE
jgi:hypothetical protein